MIDALPLIAQAWCPWCDDHMGWGGSAMMMGWSLILVVPLAWFIWMLMREGGWRGRGTPTSDPAEDALRSQYARGEIDEETYQHRLAELRRT